MANLQPEKLNTEEVLMLQEMLGNSALMNALSKIFGAAEQENLHSMRAEALGQTRVGEIVKSAAASRVCSEWEMIVKRGMERLAPQRR